MKQLNVIQSFGWNCIDSSGDADINTSLEDLILFKVTKIIAFSLNA